MSRPLRSSFRGKLLLSFLVIGIVPLVVCALLMLNIFQVSLTNNAEETARTQLATLSGDLGELLSGCQGVMEDLQVHPMVLRALSDPAPADAQNVYNTLYTSAAALLRDADFSLYDAAGKRLYSTARSAVPALPANWGVLAAAREAEGIVYRDVAAYGGAAPAACMRAALAVRDRGRVLGYVVADLTEAHFRRLFDGKYGATSDVLLLDPFWSPVYASPSLRDDALAPRLRAQLLAGQGLSDPAGAYTYHVLEHGATGFCLVLQQPKPLADWITRLLYLAAAFSILLCLGLCVAVSMGFTRQLFAPIRALNSAMASVEEGDLDVRLPVSGTDEMSQLAGRFNRMTQRLKTNLADSLRQQKELGDAQIRMMQAQLNPHFLYNTLDTVKWLGKINQVPEVATISADLADILRSSISADEFVPLSQELHLLDRYVEIQKIRFSGAFELNIQADVSVLDALVPKLMLQPLVENAIVHGFDASGGTITITAKAHGGELVLTVRDDGCGMSEESLRNFQSEILPGPGRHLGLHNVDAILRLHYGPGHGLRFIPVQGPGTCIRITLPITKSGGEEPC